MNKQIAILAIACLVVSLVVTANILPRVLAQSPPGELEKKIQAVPSITNATQNQKTVILDFFCKKQYLSQGEKLEDAGCILATNGTTFPVRGTCVASSLLSSKDIEGSCDFKPLR